MWTRKVIADLLVDAFNSGPAEMPFVLRSQAWTVLRVLTEDPDPSSHDASRGSEMDPATKSLNSIRGRAMHAVINYGVWVRRHLKDATEKGSEMPRSFDAIPEMRDLLKEHLKIAIDSSPAVRAVYGWKFPRIVHLDPGWAEAHHRDIFPPEEPLRALREAAWNAYVVFNQPYTNVVPILHEEYSLAIDGLDMSASDQTYAADPDARLAEHLMTRYWHGALGLNDEMLDAFFAKAPDDLREHALRFIGRSLRDAGEVFGGRARETS